MILAIDIGNTYTHSAIYKDNKLISFKNFETYLPIKSTKTLERFIGNKKISIIGISSVVPKINSIYKNLFSENFNLKPIFINGKIKLPINLKLDNPESTGSDRICNAVFGYEHFKRKENVLIIDVGTAITYDVILKNGDFIGGVIAPGINLLSQSLNEKTSQLPLLKENDIKVPEHPIGKNTNEAIRAGILYSTIDSVNGMIDRICKFLKIDFQVILTGGDSHLIKSHLRYKVIEKEHCVLNGINIILHNINED